MSHDDPIAAAKRLAETKPTIMMTLDHGITHADICGFCDDEDKHAPDCPILQLPAIVAALEQRERLVEENQRLWAEVHRWHSDSHINEPGQRFVARIAQADCRLCAALSAAATAPGAQATEREGIIFEMEMTVNVDDLPEYEPIIRHCVHPTPPALSTAVATAPAPTAGEEAWDTCTQCGVTVTEWEAEQHACAPASASQADDPIPYIPPLASFTVRGTVSEVRRGVPMVYPEDCER